jgi:hypothetical protein
MIEINSNNYFNYPEEEFYYSSFIDEKNYVYPVKVKVKKVNTIAERFSKNAESFDQFDVNFFYFTVISLDEKKIYWSNQKNVNTSVKLYENLTESIMAFKNDIHTYYKSNERVYKENDLPPLLDEITFCGKKEIRKELVKRLNELEHIKKDEMAREKIKELIKP